MSTSNEIKRIKKAKQDIGAEISNKGVAVPQETKIDEYPALIRQIPKGESIASKNIPVYSVEQLRIDWDRLETEGSFSIPADLDPEIIAAIQEMLNNSKQENQFYLERKIPSNNIILYETMTLQKYIEETGYVKNWIYSTSQLTIIDPNQTDDTSGKNVAESMNCSISFYVQDKTFLGGYVEQISSGIDLTPDLIKNIEAPFNIGDRIGISDVSTPSGKHIQALKAMGPEVSISNIQPVSPDTSLWIQPTSQDIPPANNPWIFLNHKTTTTAPTGNEGITFMETDNKESYSDLNLSEIKIKIIFPEKTSSESTYFSLDVNGKNISYYAYFDKYQDPACNLMIIEFEAMNSAIHYRWHQLTQSVGRKNAVKGERADLITDSNGENSWNRIKSFSLNYCPIPVGTQFLVFGKQSY